MTMQDSFMQRVLVDESGCWRWLGAHSNTGYGTLTVDGVTKYAHRYSWFLKHGDWPVGMLICHTCDVRDCVNPAHMFLGTHTDNQRDKLRKGRGRRGPIRHRGSLDADKAAEIRRLFAAGKNKSELARMFGVRPGTIRFVIQGRLWREVQP